VRAAVLRHAGAGAWVFLPQAVARLSAVYVFAVAAQRVTAEQLGILAIATAATAGSFAVAPAMVGKPLAVLGDLDLRRERGPMAQSLAVALSLAVAAVLALAAVAAEGSLQLALAACAIGVPAAMVVETHYWRTVFVSGRRSAGLVLTGSFLAQSAAVTVAAVALPDAAVVLSPFVGLWVTAGVLLAVDRDMSLAGAGAWLTEHRPTWLPFMLGVGASVTLVQAIPVVLSVTAGLAAASVYRAGELLFGGTNLLIGVISQTLLTQDTRRLGRAFRLGGALLVVTALVNGVLLALLPNRLLEALVGPTAALLGELLPALTAQRAALGLASVGSILLVRVLSARRVGALAVGAAALNLALLIVGSVAGGVVGGITGMAIAESLIAAYYVLLIRRST
jgi:hypothetical protein